MLKSRLIVTALCTAPLFSLPACMSAYHQSQGLQVVDDLVTRVETVHVDCELSRQAVRSTVDAMVELISPKGNPDRVQAFAAFEAAIEQSVTELNAWSRSIDSLEASGERFFAGWAKDLDAYSSQQMRIQSRSRMDETRGMYEQILLSAEAPLAAHAKFNAGMADVRLFLARDFNTQSLRTIEPQLRELIRDAGALEQAQDVCMQSARRYVELSGLPDQVAVPEGEVPAAK